MKPSMLYIALGGSVEVPAVDPAGCDVVVWKLGSEFYFAEVANGQIYLILDDMLGALLDWWPATYTIGIVNDGVLGIFFPGRLQ